MKKFLLATIALAFAAAGMAQEGKRGMNSLVEEYTRNAEDTLVVEQPGEITVTKDESSYTVNIKGEYNGYLYDINIKNSIAPRQYLVITSKGIEFEQNDTILFASPGKVTFCKNSKESRVTIEGIANDIEYTYSIAQSGNANESKTVYRETDSN